MFEDIKVDREVMLCKRPDSVSEQTNSSQGDKAGKRCNGIGGGIRKTIEM